MGPIIIFDKSALQSLSVDESVWLDTFYLTNITPLFFVETSADLEKSIKDGRTPEQVVGNLAEKTPVMSGTPNVHHAALALSELLGNKVEQEGRIIITGGKRVIDDSKRGFVFEASASLLALERWQDGEFQEVERQFAKQWRDALSGLDLRRIYERYRMPKGMKLKDLAAAKRAADRQVMKPSNYDLFQGSLDALDVPPPLRGRIEERWRMAGEPALGTFAPYVGHIVTIDLLFNLGIGSELIGRERPSNKIDIAYLYYLPFCAVFASGDKLPARLAPHVLRPDQVFISATELKTDRKRDRAARETPDPVVAPASPGCR